MKLNEKGLSNHKYWQELGYTLPKYDRSTVIKNTNENPKMIHFGSGNIFRIFYGNLVQNLLNEGIIDTGLIVAEGYDYEIIEKINKPNDNYSIAITLKTDGSIKKTIIGSIIESLILDSENEKDFGRLREIFKKESLQIVSFTITEKGYSLIDGEGKLLPSIAKDMKEGPNKPESYIGKIVSLLYTRYINGESPIAMVSMDNCSRNGDKLHNAVIEIAKKWSEYSLVESEFLNYINNNNKVSFPWTMIDKITPRPSSKIEEVLKKDGLEEIGAIITEKNTYIAPFVNAEECEYLIVEDSFPNGRPSLEKVGVIFTTRDNVEKVEKMKVCTCLNPLHTALAIFGCILNYDLICDEMKDKTLRKLVEGIGYKEGLPVVVDPGILNPKEFIDRVLNVRLSNVFMEDTPQRIATDTSQKLAIRFGETIKAYKNSSELDIADLKLIPLVFAGWLRYLMGIDDNGNKFELSQDPMLNSLTSIMSSINIGDNKDFEEILKPILEDKRIFGVNLYEVSMATTVCNYFKEMISEIGAVKATLEKYV